MSTWRAGPRSVAWKEEEVAVIHGDHEQDERGSSENRNAPQPTRLGENDHAPERRERHCTSDHNAPVAHGQDGTSLFRLIENREIIPLFSYFPNLPTAPGCTL